MVFGGTPRRSGAARSAARSAASRSQDTDHVPSRSFRIDRIDSVSLLADSYRVPANFSVDGVTRNGKPFQSQDATTLTIRYSPRVARWIAEREKAALANDGSLTLEHPLADEEWAVRHVLQYGPDAEVLAPERVRRAVQECLEGMSRELASA
jgi:predicted DNA-binding transcriptional regulator YafY